VVLITGVSIVELFSGLLRGVFLRALLARVR
jgi:hypothetical protein